MAFSEEQEKQILDTMGKFNEFLSSQNKEPEKEKEPEKKDETLLDKAKDTVQKETN